MYYIILTDGDTVNSYAAGDPTPGVGANEFETYEEAAAAIAELPEPSEGERWEVWERA